MPLIALSCLVGLVCPLVSVLFALSDSMLSWLVDLAAHWQWLFLLGLVLAGVRLTWSNRRWALLFLALPLPYLTASAQAPETAQAVDTFTVISANVHRHNKDPRPLVEWIARQQADVVALFEVSPAFAERLAVDADFPYQRFEPRRDPFGLAVISRHPMTAVSVLHDRDGIPHMELALQWRQRTLALSAIHPMPPIEPHYRRVRDEKLQRLARKAVELGHPAIIVGDMNATPWSSAFSGMQDQGIQRVTGLAPSWPALFAGVMGIPIDHVLVSRHWAWIENGMGPDIGSDHFPVVARLVLQRDTAGP